MQVATGMVADGRVVVEGVWLPEGAVVTIIARGDDQAVERSEADEQELLAAVQEIQQGEFVSLDELLSVLQKSD